MSAGSVRVQPVILGAAPGHPSQTMSGQTPDAKYDLTQELAPFMDVHFMFALLDFLVSKKIYASAEILQAKLALLKPTKMVDFALEVAQSLGDSSAKSALESRRAVVLEELNTLKASCSPMLDLLDKEEALLKQLHATKILTPGYLAERHGITMESLEAFFQYAKFQYECGNYQDALVYLSYYSAIVPTSTPPYVAAIWGKLACEILLEQYDEAMSDLTHLMDLIESEVCLDAR